MKHEKDPFNICMEIPETYSREAVTSLSRSISDTISLLIKDKCRNMDVNDLCLYLEKQVHAFILHIKAPMEK